MVIGDISKEINIFDSKLLRYQKLINNNVVKEEHLKRLKDETQEFVSNLEVLIGDDNEILNLILEKGHGIPGMPTVWHHVPRPGDVVSDHIDPEYLKQSFYQVSRWLESFKKAVQEESEQTIDKERLSTSLPLLKDVKNVEELIISAYDKLSEGKYLRNVIDDSRLAFENALRETIYDSSLEKNVAKQDGAKSRLENYLASHQVSERLIAMIQEFATNFVFYNNKGVKHQGSDAEKTEFSLNEARLVLFFTVETIIFIKSLKKNG